MRVSFWAALLLLLPFEATAARTVDVWGEAVAGAEMTDRATKRAALDDARAAALRAAGEVEVRSAGLYRDGLERAHFLQSLARGWLVGEEILEWRAEAVQECPADPPALRYRVRIRATVAEPPGGRAAPALRAALNRSAFEAGEQAEVSVEAAREAWLYLVHLSGDDRASLLFPNPAQAENRVAAGAAVRFPSPASGTALDVTPLAGEAESREAFLLLAYPERAFLEAWIPFGESLPIPELYRRLLQLPTGGPETILLPYTVRARER